MHCEPTIGSYVLRREIGSGAMGTVYEALHRTSGRRVAIKVLHARYVHDEHIAFRFANEGRAASLVDHPNVVQVYESANLPDGASYLVLEFIEGESLASLMQKVGQLSPSRSAAIGVEIARALSVAHARGVVHRDLKLENVMLVSDREHPDGERVKLLDFGIAKLSQEHIRTTPRDLLTVAGDILGTPHYMAPEQCLGAKEVDGKVDVYALGVLLYRILTGSPPFQGKTLREITAQHLSVLPPPLASVAPAVPAELATLIHRMLAKMPQQRPSMEEVANELARLAARFTATADAVTLPAVRSSRAPSSAPQKPRSDLVLALMCLRDGVSLAWGEHPVAARAATAVAALFTVQFVLMFSVVFARLAVASGR